MNSISSKLIFQATVLCLCLLANAVTAGPQSIDIEADHMEMDLDTGTSIYTGNVRLTRVDMVLTGERMVVVRNENSSRQVELTGKPATYKQTTDEQTTHASSASMTFDERSDILTLESSAVLNHDNQVIKSEFIRFNTSERVLLAGGKDSESGKHRVNITLNPEQE